jgi:acylphosphatase
MNKRFLIKVSGRVQGVFYRASTQERAYQLGLKGFVRNEHDGGVYIEVEGDEATLDKFIAWCKQGPRMAKVDTVNVEEAAWVGFKEFEVKR